MHLFCPFFRLVPSRRHEELVLQSMRSTPPTHHTHCLSRSAATWVSLRPVPWTSAVRRVLETRLMRCKGVKLVGFEHRGVPFWIPGHSLGLGKLTWRLSLALRFPPSFRPVCLVETINETFLFIATEIPRRAPRQSCWFCGSRPYTERPGWETAAPPNLKYLVFNIHRPKRLGEVKLATKCKPK